MNFRSLASNWPLLLVGAAFAFWIVKILRIPRDQRAHPTSRPDITSETGEGFFDLVSSARKAYVNEEDPDYRAPVIRGLAAAW